MWVPTLAQLDEQMPTLGCLLSTIWRYMCTCKHYHWQGEITCSSGEKHPQVVGTCNIREVRHIKGNGSFHTETHKRSNKIDSMWSEMAWWLRMQTDDLIYQGHRVIQLIHTGLYHAVMFPQGQLQHNLPGNAKTKNKNKKLLRICTSVVVNELQNIGFHVMYQLAQHVGTLRK